MKKLCSVFIAFFIAIAIGTTAFAADYHNEEAGFYLDLPEDCFVVYPEMTEKYFVKYSKYLNKSYNEVIDFFAESGNACGIFSYKDDCEISVWIEDSDYRDYRIEEDEVLETDLNDLCRSMDESAEILESEVYHNEYTSFLRISLTDDEGGMYREIYVIFNNGKTIYFQLYTYTNFVTPEQSERFKAVIDGFDFDSYVEETADYYNEDAGFSVDAPEDGYVFYPGMTLEYFKKYIAYSDRSYTEIISDFIENNRACEIHNFNDGRKVIINIFEGDFIDYRTATEEELLEHLNKCDAVIGENAEIIEKDIYRSKRTAFLKLLYEDYEEDCIKEVYITFANSRSIFIELYPNGKTVTGDERDYLKQIADSIKFGTIRNTNAEIVQEENTENTEDKNEKDVADIEKETEDTPKETVESDNEGSGNLLMWVPILIAAIVIAVLAATAKKKGAGKRTKTEAEQTEVPPVTEASVHNFCACCGAKLHEGSAFCHECGAPVKK